MTRRRIYPHRTLTRRESNQRYYRKHKEYHRRKNRRNYKKRVEKKWKKKLQLLFWIWNELEKVEQYERDYPPKPKIKRKVKKIKKPKYPTTKVKKPFDYKQYIRRWAKRYRRKYGVEYEGDDPNYGDD